MRSKRGLVVCVVALLTAVATVTPAVARPPAGSLIVTVESEGAIWANSDGDHIEFLVTVTNKTRGAVSAITLTFPGIPDPIVVGDLGKRQSLERGPLSYTVDAAVDFEGLAPATQAEVVVGEATASGTDGGGNPVAGTGEVVMTAYPVLPCDQETPGAPFTFTTSEDYSVCAFQGTGDWTMTTTLGKPPRGRSTSPSATVRDGVPGNWCKVGDPIVDGRIVIDYQFFPEDGVCLLGGAGGDTIPVRNNDTFYLATWKGNVVDAAPGGP